MLYYHNIKKRLEFLCGDLLNTYLYNLILMLKFFKMVCYKIAKVKETFTSVIVLNKLCCPKLCLCKPRKIFR